LAAAPGQRRRQVPLLQQVQQALQWQQQQQGGTREEQGRAWMYLFRPRCINPPRACLGLTTLL
jgi:hypothetical protein